MFELNEQELEQVAGGHHGHYGSNSAATGSAFADFGIVESSSSSSSIVNRHFAKSSAENDSNAIGINVGASSAAATSAGAGR